MSLTPSRLTTYSAAAVASFAASQASGAIIYSGLQNVAIGQSSSQGIDLDSNGSIDLTLKNYIFQDGNYQGAVVDFSPGRIVGFNIGGIAYVSNLAPGFMINSGSLGPTFIGSLAYGANNPNAQFNNANPGIIGFSFPEGASTLFGWVRVSINNTTGTFTIVDWAYESSVGAGIAAGAIPEPSVACSLGLLAAGAAGLGIYRRRRAA